MRAAELHRLARTLREIALEATGNTGADSVTAGELAVLEDIARHPRSTIRDITERTGLAQSLVSRIVHAGAAKGALAVGKDDLDRRKVRVDLTAGTRNTILERASNTIDDAIATHAPQLQADERAALEQHLAQAAALLRRGAQA
ncbi:MAG TPA: MarR family transcriptional regulator [Gemmatimonadales bacterium]|nr:MarR family transcriptional regulator [Gemmatimonadales bacterium]